MNDNIGVRVDFYNYSCNSCQSRKVKCDRKLPTCSTCIKAKINCQYGGNKKRGRKSNQEKQTIQREVEDLNSELSFTKALAQAWSKVFEEYRGPLEPTKYDDGAEIFIRLPNAWKALLQAFEENYKIILAGYDNFATNYEIAQLVWNTSISTPSEFQQLWLNLEIKELAIFIEYLASFCIGKYYSQAQKKLLMYYRIDDFRI